jgi:hypothetical protein
MSEKLYTPRISGKKYAPRIPDPAPPRRALNGQPLQWGTPRRGPRGGDTNPLPWGLYPVGDGEYGITVGSIFKTFGSLDGAELITIVDDDTTFTPSATTIVYLEYDNTTPATPVLTLKTGAAWAEHPLTFKLSTTGVQRAEKSYFRLWHGVSGDKPEYSIGIQFDGFWMSYTSRANHLVMAYGDHELADSTNHIAVPILVSM